MDSGRRQEPAEQVSGIVGELWCYPVKGACGVPLGESLLGPLGLEHDRRWMIVRPDGRFLTQREEPRLARLVPRFERDRLLLAFDGCEVALPLEDVGEPVGVTVWRDRVEAVAPDPSVDRMLSEALSRPVRIVKFPDRAVRSCDPAFAPARSRTAFADGFPLLVTSTASLAALNTAIGERGGAPVPMDRFRPNLVLEGPPAWAEDRATRLAFADGTTLLLVKPCARCIVTTTDQETGARLGPEPIATLRALDRDLAGEGPCFGQNAVPLLPNGPVRLRRGERFVLGA